MKTVWRVFAYLRRYPWMAAGTLTCAVLSTLLVIVVLGVMFYLSWELTLLSLTPAPFLAGGALWYTLTAHRRYRLQRRASSAMNALLHDNLAGIRQIKSFVREHEQHGRFNKVS